MYLQHLFPHYLKERYKSRHEIQALAAANYTNKENATKPNIYIVETFLLTRTECAAMFCIERYCELEQHFIPEDFLTSFYPELE